MKKNFVAAIVLGIVLVGGVYVALTSTTTSEKNMSTSGGEEMMNDAPTSSAAVGAMTDIEGDALAPVDDSTKDSATVTPLPEAQSLTAVFGNGCFWCVEHDMATVPGVVDVVSGYTGGTTESPNYSNYAEGGHREVILVTYDPAMVTYAQLVEHIIKHGDPTDAGGSFKDRGAQYAPAVYFANESERLAAQAVIEAVDRAGVFEKPLPLPVLPRVTFFPAEEYHQDYAEKNPIRYNYYRAASGRTGFITAKWGDELERFTYSKTPVAAKQVVVQKTPSTFASYSRPEDAVLRGSLSKAAYAVTRENDTERAGTSPLDKEYASGIYVDVVSGEPLFSSRDKFDSGTGWPSFVQPITKDAVTLHSDNTLFSTRTEVRSRYADSHLGHVFDDGPVDRGGKRYCMNGVALRFIAKADMVAAGYEYWVTYVD